jgi:NadR type nicotinamide-nucleotide adenylyltransferase
MPLHLGHQFLIDTAIDQCDRVTVIVCSLPSDPIPGTIRADWVTSAYQDAIGRGRVRVQHLSDAWVPQDPTACRVPNVFFQVWAGIIRAYCGETPTAVFTSEYYGDPVAEALGCRHILVDHHRKTVPISGTQCRQQPFRHWEYMPPHVRTHFTKRIAIVGAESTGKSTLAAGLADYYREQRRLAAVDVQEVARTWIDTELAGDMTRLEFSHITRFGHLQMSAVAAVVRTGNVQVVFSDTDAIASRVFQHAYFNRVDPDLDAIITDEQWDLMLVLLPDVPWVDDGQRNLAHFRTTCTKELLGFLDQHHLPYVTIAGNWRQRCQAATYHIVGILAP